MRDSGCVSNARETENHAIGPLVLGRSLRFAEQNGAKVIAAVDLPESVLVALAGLVDAISQEFSALAERNEAAEVERQRQERPMCRWHLGQFADYCGPCRSERIGAA